MQQLQDVFILQNMRILNEGKTGPLKVRGIFQRADEANMNMRVYPQKVLEGAIKSLNEAIKERRLVGELDHPTYEMVKLSNASHLITGLWMEGKEVIGEAEILPTPAGKVVEGLIQGGVKIGISSRGMGTLSEGKTGHKTVNEDFKLVTFDIVADPSTRGAYPSLMESKQYKKDKQVIESTIKQVVGERYFLKLLEKRINDKLNERVRDVTEPERVGERRPGSPGVFQRIGHALGAMAGMGKKPPLNPQKSPTATGPLPRGKSPFVRFKRPHPVAKTGSPTAGVPQVERDNVVRRDDVFRVGKPGETGDTKEVNPMPHKFVTPTPEVDLGPAQAHIKAMKDRESSEITANRETARKEALGRTKGKRVSPTVKNRFNPSSPAPQATTPTEPKPVVAPPMMAGAGFGMAKHLSPDLGGEGHKAIAPKSPPLDVTKIPAKKPRQRKVNNAPVAGPVTPQSVASPTNVKPARTRKTSVRKPNMKPLTGQKAIDNDRLIGSMATDSYNPIYPRMAKLIAESFKQK